MLVCVDNGIRTLRAKRNNATLIRLSPVEYLAPQASHECSEIRKNKRGIPSPESSS